MLFVQYKNNKKAKLVREVHIFTAGSYFTSLPFLLECRQKNKKATTILTIRGQYDENVTQNNHLSPVPGGLIYLAILASRRFWQHDVKGV